MNIRRLGKTNGRVTQGRIYALIPNGRGEPHILDDRGVRMVPSNSSRYWESVDDSPESMVPKHINCDIKCVAQPIIEDKIEETEMKIERAILIDGKRADEYSDGDVLRMIVSQSEKMDKLGDIKPAANSKFVKGKIEEHRDNIKQLVDVLDSRVDQE